MALKRKKGDPGTVIVLEHVSEILKDNPLGDPHVRKLGVWLPPGYDESGKRRFPVLYDLVGFTGSGLSHLGWKPFGDNVPERAARLMHEGKMGPAIFVFPDCFTSLGGNQYVNSSAIGNYADYLTRELDPVRRPGIQDAGEPRAPRLLRQVLRRLRRHRPRHEVRALLGRDRQPLGRRLLRLRLLARLAQHAERALQVPRCPSACPGATTRSKESRRKGLAEGKDDGRIRRFLQQAWKKEKLSGAETHCIMNLCMAATYDPDPRAPLGFRVPFNLESGEVIEERWRAVAQARPDPPGAKAPRRPRFPESASTSTAGGATSTTSTTARAFFPRASPPPASGTRMKSSTTTIPTSTTGWTSACRSSIAR